MLSKNVNSFSQSFLDKINPSKPMTKMQRVIWEKSLEKHDSTLTIQPRYEKVNEAAVMLGSVKRKGSLK